ncbi:MAG: metallophosphoesterase family protein [Planctomycetes bacterium]|nr:metallophosphoesterase family protein [Planctomycetota bacterium]
MRVLICADAHANLPGVEAVLGRADEVDRRVFLGDAISYGPHPKECLDLVVDRFDLVLAGNHDLDAITDREPPPAGAFRDGYEWDQWTKAQLTERDRDMIRNLPTVADETWDGVRVHLEHRLPGPYITPETSDEEIAERIQTMPGEMIFVGHNHRSVDRTVGGVRLIDPGSLGQQRDGDPRISYAVFEARRVEFFRAAYDVARTQRDVRALPLRGAFINCWCRFLQQGVVDVRSIPRPS